MVFAIFLAYLFPEFGGEGGGMHADLVTKIGIAVIFFLNGALLPLASLKDGISRWKLHLIIQGATFLIFPLLGLALYYGARDFITDENLRLGFFYLCALPSTVSSSVAMTSAARGNVPVAVFNATLSSLLGILLTPLWISVVLHQTGSGMDIGDVVLDLAKWLLLPLIIGQCLRPLIGAWITKRKAYANKIDRFTILLLVYTSFCDSFLGHIWTGHRTETMVLILLATALLFFFVLAALWLFCDALKIESHFRSAVVFCGTKKSLANGVPMARLIFGANPALSLILLPIMVYHPLQLFICGPLASRWARQASVEETLSNPS